MKTKLIQTALTTFLMGVLIGMTAYHWWLMPRGVNQRLDAIKRQLEPQGKVSIALLTNSLNAELIALSQWHVGVTNEAIRTLEYSVNRSIINLQALNQQQSILPEAQRVSIKDAVNRVREYRKQFPFTTGDARTDAGFAEILKWADK